MSPEEIAAGAPTAFDLGRLSGHVEIMGREIGTMKKDVEKKVDHDEFQRAVRALGALNILILAAIVGLAFAALHPRPAPTRPTPAAGP